MSKDNIQPETTEVQVEVQTPETKPVQKMGTVLPGNINDKIKIHPPRFNGGLGRRPSPK